MRLTKIKLAGFKSFVEPTTIHLPSNLVGIVGPNGCGKSNVIDAVRWVMGESSAKHLRGDSMADVIFNGSATRKPVGTATIELFFDNSDGAVGGQYAGYGEICIKRTVGRDGQSQYFLNNTRCRRKDITGIFLGTGLGARSYAIIEQGMVSRLIEAKPDELRVYIEEAAGISKYKERRRETEHRIRHTRDNLDRLNDLRDEVTKQIEHLDRQAKQAERYKASRQEQRKLEAELLVLRLAELDQKLAAKEQELSQSKTGLEAAIAEQRSIEAAIEQSRALHTDAADSFNAIQGRFYAVQSEISRLEQAIGHARDSRDRMQQDKQQAEEQLAGVRKEIEQDQGQLLELDTSLQQLAPDLELARTTNEASAKRLAEVEAALEAWKNSFHEFNLEAKEYQQTSSVERARIEHMDARLAELRGRKTVVDAELSELSIDDLQLTLGNQTVKERESSERLEALMQRLRDTDERIAARRDEERTVTATLEQQRGELESSRGRHETLAALQKAALGEDQDAVNRWVSGEGLQKAPRLAQQLSVEQGWELAVETVLGDFLQAICVPRCDDHLGKLPAGDVVLVEQHAHGEPIDAGQTLLAHVSDPRGVGAVLGAVRTADSLDAALAIRGRLQGGESVITRDGVWLGPDWVRVSRGKRRADGVLSRQQDLRKLAAAIQSLEQSVKLAGRDRDRLRAELEQLESERTVINQELNAANRRYAEAAAVLENLKQSVEKTRTRLGTLSGDSQAARDEIAALEKAMRESQARLAHAAEALQRLEERRPDMEQQQQELLTEYNAAREQADAHRTEVSRIQIEFESRRASRQSAHTSLDRVRTLCSQLEQRIASLGTQINAGDEPLETMQGALQTQLEQEIKIQAELAEQRRRTDDAESKLRAEEGRRTDAEQKVSEAREAVDNVRMSVRELEVRREGLADQFAQTGLDMDVVKAGMPDDAEANAWNEQLALVGRRIERMGAINLAAIEEFQEQSERKVYLDAQFEDLTSALDTLETAIRKIDRETRTRFQETFDNINSGLKRIFPRLFGGGHAYLSLEGDEVLDAGVSVMARPPGKRNSHIQLLSGGEKAMTAVALIFSIFELNPAPFCLLDEVDAPLDDANVGRFCDIVAEMSKNIQFVIITHNKTTMEMTRQLTGVTMNEPGVSRLVSVDIDEAVQLAAS